MTRIEAPDTASMHEEGRKTGLHQAAVLLRAEATRILKVEHLSIAERRRRHEQMRKLAATVETLK